jgi:hypothetical protein
MPSAGTMSINKNSALKRTSSNIGSESIGNGGGIYVTSATSDVNVSILSGIIENNSCDNNGGGICVDMSGSSAVAANVTIGENGSTTPNITGNKSIRWGGGLYAKGEKAQVTINGGKIQNNIVSNYVANEDVTNELGTVVLNGGDVEYVTVTFDLNIPSGQTASFPTGTNLNVNGQAFQNIVTATNTRLVYPGNPTCSNHNFVEWNTRADGDGVSYKSSEEKIMNIENNLTLYAIWSAQ